MERKCRTLPPTGVSAAVWSAPALLLDGERGASSGLFAAAAWALRLNWVVGNTLPFVSLGTGQKFGQQSFVAGRPADPQRLAATLRDAPVLLETFVEVGRYRGTCYQAANWIRLGVTRGEWRMGRHSPHRSVPRAIYVYPLIADFRSFLQGRSDESAQPSGATERRAEA